MGDLLRIFASWGCCFSAAVGQPRFFYALVRHVPADEIWEIDVLHCRVPPRDSATWESMGVEISEALAAGRCPSTTPCKASRFCRLELFGPDYVLQRCDLAPSAEIEAIGKELFGAQGL